MDGTEATTTVKVSPEGLTIDGVSISWYLIPLILHEFAHPDPRRWFRLERIDDSIQFTVKMTEDGNGTNLGTIGKSEERPGGKRDTTSHS